MKYKMLRLYAVAATVVSLSFFATGCAQKTVRTDDEAASAAAAATRGEAMGAEESLSASASSRAQDAFSEGRTSRAMLPVYFDFDQSNIRSDQKGRIDGNAYYLKTSLLVFAEEK